MTPFSAPDFAEFVIGVTGSLCTYMLRRLDLLAETELQYADNPDFNQYLDEQFPLDGRVSYSLAFFEQEPETYEIDLGDYKLEEEENEEPDLE